MYQKVYIVSMRIHHAEGCGRPAQVHLMPYGFIFLYSRARWLHSLSAAARVLFFFVYFQLGLETGKVSGQAGQFTGSPRTMISRDRR